MGRPVALSAREKFVYLKQNVTHLRCSMKQYRLVLQIHTATCMTKVCVQLARVAAGRVMAVVRLHKVDAPSAQDVTKMT